MKILSSFSQILMLLTGQCRALTSVGILVSVFPLGMELVFPGRVLSLTSLGRTGTWGGDCSYSVISLVNGDFSVGLVRVQFSSLPPVCVLSPPDLSLLCTVATAGY